MPHEEILRVLPLLESLVSRADLTRKCSPDGAEVGAIKHATNAAKRAMTSVCFGSHGLSCLLSDYQVHDCTSDQSLHAQLCCEMLKEQDDKFMVLWQRIELCTQRDSIDVRGEGRARGANHI